MILWQTWRFITPGLKAKERRYIIPFVTASLVFFGAGVVLAYFSFTHAIQFLKDIGGSTLLTEYNPNQYLTLFLLMMFIFGLAFLFPVILVALELANVVTPSQLLHVLALRHDRHHDRSAVFTPSGDPLSMCASRCLSSSSTSSPSAVGKLLHK